MHILRCMGSKFCVKFQRAPLKFHTKFWTHTPQNMNFTVFFFCVWVTISLNCDVISLSETGPRGTESIGIINLNPSSGFEPSFVKCVVFLNRPSASIHKANGRLTTRSHEFSKPWVSDYAFSNLFETYEAHRQQSYRDAFQISKWYVYHNIQ